VACHESLSAILSRLFDLLLTSFH